ncbi:hypothetical protein ZWY2020_032364 [Hordeum vulgare]|nr:hypothetical protein ZWY2020_032364 [Hordeum vulgare]
MTNLPRFGFERLIELLSLNLSNTYISGQIPIGIAHLENLLTLDLSDNGLYLREPNFRTLIANMSNLRSLSLDTVQILSGGSTWSIALADSVPLLQDISLSWCGITGPIHYSFSQLRFLATINLEVNGISGQVPSFFAQFSFLRYLRLFDNDFEGHFPTKIFQLENLTYLDVSYNPSLSVQLPDFPPGNILGFLDLRETNLSVAIPNSLFHLDSLKALGLSTTGFPKHLITSIANLTSLEQLWLSGSGIEKPALSWIAGLKNLTDLMLVDYNFSGPIPWWIRNCTNLTALQLSSCNLSGEIPTWIGNLTKLSILYLSDNRLSGKIPSVLFNLVSLEKLYLSSNELYGTLENIPDRLSTFLKHIDLSHNNLAGHIPKSLFDLTRLQYLSLDSNQFEGTVDLCLLWKMKALDTLRISNNMLSVIDVEGGYPFTYIPRIRELGLAHCNLTKIPVALKYVNEMIDLDLSNNRIDGVMPSWIWVKWKDSISSLDLSNNMFASLENSPSIVHMYNLYHLNLSSNKLHGTVPIPLISMFEAASLDYSNNSFSSIMPDFGRSICTQQYLEILDLSYNNFSGVVPSCLMQGISRLNMLKLRENHFNGMLPENIGEGCMLETIDLNTNRIEGKIPKSLSNCQGLQLLDVGNNQIVGSFPSWLGVLPHLRVLVLRSNQLNGTIRDINGDRTINNYFASLQILDLASNNFSGNVPNGWFNELKAMMENVSDEGQVLGHDANSSSGFYQDTVTITFKGFDLSFTKILSTFKAIDLSNNSFDGPLPESIAKLVSLRGLNVSYNNFTGQIPYQYDNLSQLESMDLSWNQITGEIPQELTSLTSLEWLNLSCNNLYGRIPQGNQFSTFSDSSFEGNAGLCGVQLSKHCDNQSSIAPSEVAPPESDSLWEDKRGVILLFAFVGLGFGVGFALSFLLRLYCRMEGCVCKQS